MDGKETHTFKADEIGRAHRSRQVRRGAASSDPIHQVATVRYTKAAFGLAGDESYVGARDYDALAAQFASLQQGYEECMQERDNLKATLNTPETEDFFKGIKLEAAHQRLRWPSEHDAGKTHADWFWLVGYLAGKCLHAAITGDSEKALHHTISTAAALANWHRAIKGFGNMRPGIDTPQEASITKTAQPAGKVAGSD